jgi:hypothetical protein
MAISWRTPGRFSSRQIVDWEARSRPDGSASWAIVTTGSARRRSASLPSSSPAAIIFMRKPIMSARLWTTWSGDRGSSMHAARRSATRSRRSTCARAITPLSDDSRPPSKRATTALPRTGDKPSNGSVGSFMAGVASQK